MLAQQKQLLNYWRASIKNEQIIGIKIKDSQYKDYLLSKDFVTNTGITAEEAKQLFENNKKYLIELPYKTTAVDNNNIAAANNISVLPIVIAPRVYKRKHEHGEYKNSYKKPYMHPVWIYAYLSKEGDIFADYPCIMPPWVARDYLHPSYKQQESIIIGDIASYDDFLDQNNINNLYNNTETDQETDQEKDTQQEKQYISWEQLLDYSKKVLTHVAPALEDYLSQNGYINKEMEYMLIIPINANENKNYSVGLLKLLDSLAASSAFEPLFARYLHLQPMQPDVAKPVLSVAHQVEFAAGKHLGQITGDFPLAQSQRVALHHLLLLPEGQILAINGPPGTGKTTLLGSIIASLWVDAAIKKELPPMIVVSSTNNRAIQNVIDSLENRALLNNKFSSVIEEYLAKRWIAGVTSFGLYLTNNPKGTYHYYSDHNKSGSLQAIENSNYTHIKNYYLKNFNQCFGLSIFSLQEAADILHNKISKLQQSLQSILKIVVNYKKITEKYPKYFKEDILVAKINDLKIHLQNYKNGLDQFNNIKIAWDFYRTKLIWHRIIIIFLPFLGKILHNILAYKIQGFLVSQKITIKPELNVVTNYLKQQINYYAVRSKKIKFLINKYELHLDNIRQVNKSLEHWKNEYNITSIDVETLFDFNSVEKNSEQNILIFLDTKIRFLLFQYAVHYWEAKWILEAIRKNKSNEINRSDRQSRLNNYKHMAMLTPCFITTMQSGPSFFTFKMTHDQGVEFMLNSIDLLIIDEGSQVHPGYGAGMMALSKKACVVGDILQLPPVINIPGAVDIGNMQHCQLINHHDEYHDISKYGVNIAGGTKHGVGSVMKIAKNSSFFQENILVNNLKNKGLFLKEHRRCVPEIISYCNEFFYENKMTYHRSTNKNRLFMPMGYAHISGIEQASGASKINYTEAKSIVQWIVDKKEMFLKLYPGKSLEQIFGIITPFNAQADLIKSFVVNHGIILEQNNIGTIHTFQGGEFPVIIFSSVYSYNVNQKSRKLFFDTEYTMLNVAVSRARDHFFLFGDMEIFDASKINIPSGFLANCLLADPKNALLDVKTMHKFYTDNYNISV